MIKPTVGRVIWLFGTGQPDTSQPCAGIITYVHSDKLINVAGFDQNSNVMPKTSVTLIQEGEAAPNGLYAAWMPFQQGQAKAQAQAATSPPSHRSGQ